MKSYLFRLKLLFIFAIILTMGIIHVAQYQFSLVRALNAPPDPMIAAVKDLFDYLDEQKFEAPTVLGTTSTASESAHAVMVLYYHGITEKEDKGNVSFDHFKDQMYKLKENGYETINSRQLEDYLLHGKSLPPRSFMLTFDDGRKDSYFPVDPILKTLGFEAVMFLISSEVIDRDIYYLTEQEIKTMLDTGRWEIQAHTFDLHKDETISENGDKGHALANKLWLSEPGRLETDAEYRDRIYADLFSSKQDLEKRFNVPIKDFAFPFGDYAQEGTNYPGAKDVILDIVGKLYRFAFFQPWDKSDPKNVAHVDTKLVARIGVESSWTGEDLLAVLARHEDKYLPYSETFSDFEAWRATWGKVSTESGELRLNASPTTTGASAVLEGSNAWQDLHASVSATLLSPAESFSIFGRINSEGDSNECVFATSGIYYKEKSGGNSITVGKKKADLKQTLSSTVGLTMKIQGKNVTCALADGSLVLRAVATRFPENSQFGIGVWGSKVGESGATLHQLRVEGIYD